MNEEKKMIQTKSYFQIRGIIHGKDNPTTANGYREGTIEKGKSIGKKYRSIRFMIKTSNDNIIPIELYGQEKDKAYFYNKSQKKTVPVDWNKRNNAAKKDFTLIVPEYDLVEKINNEFNDGDAVFVSGTLQHTMYEDAQNVTRQQTKFVISKFYTSNNKIDFDDDNFEEHNQFTQELIINSIDEELESLLVNGYSINYDESFVPITLEINKKKAHSDFVKTLKKMKFGDFLKFNGIIHYRTIEELVDGAFGKRVIKDFKKSLEVVGADPGTYIKSKYKEEDFVSEKDIDVKVNWSNVEENVEVKESNELPFDVD